MSGAIIPSKPSQDFRPLRKNVLDPHIYPKKKLALEILDNSIVWHDTGNANALLEAAQKVKLYEENNELKIGSYEIASFEQGFINKNELNNIAEKFIKSDYGKYIKEYLINI